MVNSMWFETIGTCCLSYRNICPIGNFDRVSFVVRQLITLTSAFERLAVAQSFDARPTQSGQKQTSA